MAGFKVKWRGKKILIVDDDEVTRIFLEYALNAHGYPTVVASDFEATREAMNADSYALVLMDLVFVDSTYTGFDIAAYIRSVSPACPVVIMTSYPSTDSAVQALRTNASDYLKKPVYIEELLACVEKVLTVAVETRPFDSGLAARLGLTEREQDVLQLLYKGCSYTEIGKALSFSTSTAKTYGKRIYKKLDVQSRGEAVYEAVQLNLIRH